MCLYFINHVTTTVTFNYSFTCSLYYYGELTNKLLLYMGTWYFSTIVYVFFDGMLQVAI